MPKSLIETLAGPGRPTRNLVSRLWRRYAMRAIGANDNHLGLDRLYALPDPWGMQTAREQSRFAQTNAAIEREVGRVASILEVGCGEGHQSEQLLRLCTRLDGIDVSERAVARARQRLPQARFGVGDLGHLPWPAAQERYDLVVACEVLYYMSDIAQAVRQMSALGRTCVATFFCPAAHRVAVHVQDLPGARRGWIYHDPYAWLWICWCNPDGAAA